jgi:hypothetical protein
MSRRVERRNTWFILWVGLLFLCSESLGQQVGETVGIEGKAERSRGPSTAWAALARRAGILLLDQLKTQSLSKIEVLFQAGHKFTLGAEVEVRITDEPTPPGTIVLNIARGTLRVITSNQPGSSVVTRTLTAEARVRKTGFIVSCGPPLTVEPDSCLFVGLHERTEVTSATVSGPPVVLERQFFTVVRRNQLPTPPRLIPEFQFLNLISATTVIGTGAAQDRLDVGGPPPSGDRLVLQIPQRPSVKPFDPQKVIDWPREQFDVPVGQLPPLPEPPGRPVFPPGPPVIR